MTLRAILYYEGVLRKLIATRANQVPVFVV